MSGAPGRRQLLPKDAEADGRIGAAAGECAAVCCCCPCAMMHLVVLIVYRLPAGLWRKTKGKRKRINRRRRIASEKEIRRMSDYSEEDLSGGGGGQNDVVDVVWEWKGFNTAGFWRSSSVRGMDEG